MTSVPAEPAVPDALDVVWARPTATSRAAALLDPRERAALGRLTRAADQERYVAAHALLRLVIGGRWQLDPAAVGLSATCVRCGGPHGRLSVSPPTGRAPLHVSLAHAGDRVVVAVTEAGPVGVDVEPVTGVRFDGFDDVALGAGERRALADVADDDRASWRAQVWVRKEAVLKATGDGLTVDPRLVVVSAPPAPARLLAPVAAADPAGMALTDLDLGPEYAGCVALLAPGRPVVQLRDGSDLLTT